MERRLQNIYSGCNGSIDGTPLFNDFLLSLPDRECELLCPRLVFVPLRTHDVLNETGEPIKYGYFMNSGLASILNVMEDGKSVEVGVAGRDGFVGMPLLVGFESSPSRVIIQIEGSAFRVRALALAELLHACPVLETGLLRYGQLLGLQSAQLAACNRLHLVERRLARWLLMCRDRTGSDFVPLTQETLSNILGTQRSSITLAAGILQKEGAISYTPGHVKIINLNLLENAACECYGALVQQASRWNNESGLTRRAL
jgi:CRP-like cAMP-binding protein